jgi:hypothetical protein
MKCIYHFTTKTRNKARRIHEEQECLDTAIMS